MAATASIALPTKLTPGAYYKELPDWKPMRGQQQVCDLIRQGKHVIMRGPCASGKTTAIRQGLAGLHVAAHMVSRYLLKIHLDLPATDSRTFVPGADGVLVPNPFHDSNAPYRAIARLKQEEEDVAHAGLRKVQVEHISSDSTCIEDFLTPALAHRAVYGMPCIVNGHDTVVPKPTNAVYTVQMFQTKWWEAHHGDVQFVAAVQCADVAKPWPADLEALARKYDVALVDLPDVWSPAVGAPLSQGSMTAAAALDDSTRVSHAGRPGHLGPPGRLGYPGHVGRLGTSPGRRDISIDPTPKVAETNRPIWCPPTLAAHQVEAALAKALETKSQQVLLAEYQKAYSLDPADDVVSDINCDDGDDEATVDVPATTISNVSSVVTAISAIPAIPAISTTLPEPFMRTCNRRDYDT